MIKERATVNLDANQGLLDAFVIKVSPIVEYIIDASHFFSYDKSKCVFETTSRRKLVFVVTARYQRD